MITMNYFGGYDVSSCWNALKKRWKTIFRAFCNWMIILWGYANAFDHIFNHSNSRYLRDNYNIPIRILYLFLICPPAFWLGRLAFVPDGWSKPRADSEPNRPPASAGQPSGGRAAFQIRLHALYSTRPHGLVQAIFWHTCPDLDLGPWYGLTH